MCNVIKSLFLTYRVSARPTRTLLGPLEPLSKQDTGAPGSTEGMAFLVSRSLIFSFPFVDTVCEMGHLMIFKFFDTKKEKKEEFIRL